MRLLEFQMTAIDSESSRNLAQMLDQAMLRALDRKGERSVADVIADFDDVQAAALSDTSLTTELQLETRRRVAERKFSVLSERSLPYPFVETLVLNIRRLGYTNLEIEGRVEVVFARYCIREGHIDDARAILTRLLSKIPAPPSEDEAAIAKQIRELCARLLADLTVAKPK
jgi:hypothetical protein